MKLLPEIFNEIAAKIVKEGEPDDLAKFMLAGKEPIAAVQNYFYDSKSVKKYRLILDHDKWFLRFHGPPLHMEPVTKKFSALSFFAKVLAPLILPHVRTLHISNTQLQDYSFLVDIEYLTWLDLEFVDDEYIKVLTGLSNLQTTHNLSLNIKDFNLQSLSSLGFSYNRLTAEIVFEPEPVCNKVFPATSVWLHGNEEAMNDFVFDRQNYQNYVSFFPNANEFRFDFHVKVADDVTRLLEVSSPNHAAEVQVQNLYIEIRYHFFDYSGYPDSSVLKMLQDDERWDTRGCPYLHAELHQNNMEVSCDFPLAIDAVGNKLAEKSLHRIPQNSNGNPDDYHRVTIDNEWGHETEFELLKTLSIEALLEAYGQITGISPQNLRCDADLQSISNGDRIEIIYEYDE